MTVSRCVCFRVSFSTLKKYADNANIRDVQDLQQVISFGKKCGLCLPYVEMMLRTGEVEFKLIMND